MRQSDRLRRAVEWLQSERLERPGIPLFRLSDEAARRFDLDALESEWLLATALRTAKEPSEGA